MTATISSELQVKIEKLRNFNMVPDIIRNLIITNIDCAVENRKDRPEVILTMVRIWADEIDEGKSGIIKYMLETLGPYNSRFILSPTTNGCIGGFFDLLYEVLVSVGFTKTAARIFMKRKTYCRK